MSTNDTYTTLRVLLPELARLGAPRSTKLPRIVCNPCFTGGWEAYDENTYDGPGSPTGYGDTRAEAIEDLLICMEELFGDDKRELLTADERVDDLLERDL